MTHKITVSPSQTLFQAEENETVLASAIRQGYNLPHSCQSGVCGCCAARIVSGTVHQSGEYDDYVLTEEEVAAGMVLLCCCQARSDLVVDMPSYAGAKALDVRTLPARIGKIDIRGDVAVFTAALPKAPPFRFYAGQYMEILLKDGSRSYSVASAPSQNGMLEFHVRLHEGGLFSPKLFDGSLKSGDIIRLRGPLGTFYLNEESQKPLLLLATGTGLAPVKSILARLADTGSERQVYFYYGCRTRTDLYDSEAVAGLVARLPNARYTPSLSRAENDPEWLGARGYITAHARADLPDLSGFEAYACGSPAMVADAKTTLCGQNGLPECAFHADAFTAHV